MLHRGQPARRCNSNISPSGEHAADEVCRLSILNHYEILDSPPEAAFEHIAALAATIYSTPIAIISFLDRDRIWFKSHRGLVETEVGRHQGTIETTLAPLIGREGRPGFFASAPLRTCDGYHMGALCVIDRQPHPVEGHLIHHLRALADIIMDQLELRLTRRDIGSADHSTRANDWHAGADLPTNSDGHALIEAGAPDVKARFAQLTARQREIMNLVVAGCPSKIIAADLGISRRTVENHRAAIMKRTGATSLPALARLALFAAGIGARELLSLASLSPPI